MYLGDNEEFLSLDFPRLEPLFENFSKHGFVPVAEC
jgi:hypothetical protein